MKNGRKIREVDMLVRNQAVGISPKLTPWALMGIFLIIHVLTWSLAPILIRNNLPMDSLEGITWGQHLSFGYDKNPFLNAWLSTLAIYMDNYHGWMIYIFSQISVAICFISIFLLAKKITSAQYALIAVMLLECMQYYNFHTIDFNDNVLELPLWSLTTYFFYQAVTEKKLVSWGLTGLFAGLGMMAKYYTLVLLASLFLFLLSNAQTRQSLKTKEFYLGLTIFILSLLPHFIWLFSHEFITINYVFNRTSNTANWLNHIYYPSIFFWQQLQVFLPALLIYLGFFVFKSTSNPIQSDKFKRNFLVFIALGPLLITLLLSLTLGITLHGGWGSPLLTLVPLLMLYQFRPLISAYKLRVFFISILSLNFFFIAIYVYTLTYPSDKSSANFPGAEMTLAVTKLWDQHASVPLQFVAGPRWLAGNVSFYHPNHPAVYMEWNASKSYWIDEKQFSDQGALFIWNDKVTPPAWVLAKYDKRLTPMQVVEFNWKRAKLGMKPMRIYTAILPPKNAQQIKSLR